MTTSIDRSIRAAGTSSIDASLRKQRGLRRSLRCATSTLATVLCASAYAQTDRESVLEEVIVTAQFRAENLQETPLSITAVSGEQLEEQGLTNVAELGLVVPNANIRQQSSGFGPAPLIGLRGVNTGDFIYTSDPGVAVYVDDVYHGTLNGSAMDLLDLERVEVLRGPQGTLFGKNSLGGAIRLISKAPKGDDTGSIEATAGSSNRLDFKGSYDLAIVPDRLFMRVSGSSKQIDGYQDRLDFTCQMRVNGTPQLAGNLPQLVNSHAMTRGDCKIGENGGSESNAGRVMLRYLATDSLDIDLSADYSKTVGQPGVDSLLTGGNPTDFITGLYNNLYIQPNTGVRTDDNRFVTGDPFKTYATFSDPITGVRWPTEQVTESWSGSAKVEYRITDGLTLKTVAAYRTYDSSWASDGDFSPLDTGTLYNVQEHEQSSVEVQLSGSLLDDRINWTTGAFYYDSTSHLGGHVFLGSLVWFGIIPAFDQNDHFTTESQSAFAHVVFDATDRLTLTAGARYTTEDKTYRFDHTNYLTIAEPLEYGNTNVDWKLAADFKLNDYMMVYGMAATGFRSEGAQPRPWTRHQLEPFPAEEILAYEAGLKGDFFDRRLRANLALFINDYDPKVGTRPGWQCNAPTSPTPGPFVPSTVTVCPPGTDFAGQQPNIFWFQPTSTPATTRGAELELTANPVGSLTLNGSVGYLEYESDERDPTQPGYTHSTVREQPKLSYSLGAQYNVDLFGGTLMPRLDMFYQGERTNGNPTRRQIKPYDIVPDYTLYNARLTYVSPQAKWQVALAVENLFDEFYWITLQSERGDNGDIIYNRQGVPGRGREWSLSLRRNF